MLTRAERLHFFLPKEDGGRDFRSCSWNLITPGSKNQTSAELELMFRAGPQLLSLFGSIITPWQHKTGLFFLDWTQLMGKNQNSVVFSGKPNKHKEELFFCSEEEKQGCLSSFSDDTYYVGES